MITAQEAREKAINSANSKNEILDFVDKKINEASEKGEFSFFLKLEQITEEQTIEVGKEISAKGFRIAISFEKTGVFLGKGKINIGWKI